MQYVGRGNSTSQLPVDRDVIWVNEVADPHLAGDRLCAFIDPTIGRNVRMAIDDSRRDVFAGNVDHGGSCRDFDVSANRCDLSV